MRLAQTTAVVALVAGAAVATSCAGSNGSGPERGSDAGSDAGPCDPRATPNCPTDCELDFQAECTPDGWTCPEPASAFECAIDAMPECEAGAAACLCGNLDAMSPTIPKVWVCPSGADAPTDTIPADATNDAAGG